MTPTLYELWRLRPFTGRPHGGLAAALDLDAQVGLFVSGLNVPHAVTSAQRAEASVPVLGQSGPEPHSDAAGTPGLLPQLGMPGFLALVFVNAVFCTSIFHLLDLYCPYSDKRN